MKLKDLPEKELIEVLENMKVYEIAKKYRCSVATVSNLRKKYNVHRKINIPFDGKSEEEIIEILNSMQGKDVAKKYGLSQLVVSGLRKKYNISRKHKRIFDGKTDEEIIEIIEEHTLKELCEMYGVSVTCINSYADEYDIKPKGYKSYQVRQRRDGTLCWDCKNALCKCSWSQFFIPVEGWTARKTKIRNKEGAIDSFYVKACPKFEEG